MRPIVLLVTTLTVAAIVGAVGCRSARPVARPVAPLSAAAYAAYLEGKLAAFGADWPAATRALEAAVRAAPDEPVIVVELARAQAKAKRLAVARATLADARRRWPDHPLVWVASGDLFGAASRPEAIHAYRRAIELAPDDEDAYLGLAKLETSSEAEAILRQLVDKIPTSIDGHYRLAQRLRARDQLAPAIAALRAVLERDPDHLDARLELARALRRTGQLAAAIDQTRSAFDRSGQALDLAEELFWLLCEADDRTAAIDLLTLLDDDRSDADALATVARLERGLGRDLQARAIAKRLAIIDAEAGLVLAAEFELAAAPADVARRLLEVPPSSSQFVEARRLAAEGLLAAGEPAAAIEALGPAREARPKDLELRRLAAFARADAGDLAGGRALLVGGGLGPAYARARLADHVGDRAAALAELEPAVRKHPDAATALNLAGYLLADANQRLTDAERWLRRARDLAPGDPAILDSWGWLLYRKGDLRGAIRILDRAARFAPHEPEILLHLATVWAADHAPRTADAVLDRAAKLGPPAALRRRIEALRATLPGAR